VTRRTLLVVEDAPDSALAFEEALGMMSELEVRVFPNGAAAWGFIESGEGAGVCAVITDLQMPVVDGFELLRRIRSSSAHSDLPVIVVSATTDPSAPELVLHLGADAFFTKPWSPNRLRAKLEQLLYEKDATEGSV
jgi:two-component system, chemotaxis family, chemotaxis protein CheV